MAKLYPKLKRLAVECLEDRCTPSAPGTVWPTIPTPTDLSYVMQADPKNCPSIQRWADPAPGSADPKPTIVIGDSGHSSGSHGGRLDGFWRSGPPDIVSFSGPPYTGEPGGGSTGDGDAVTAVLGGWNQPYRL